MKEEKGLKQGKKPNKIRLKMTFSILVLAALFIVELYLMINYSKSYLLLGIIGLAILCFVYLTIDFSFKLRNEGDSIRGNEYENMYKAQKVSYVSMKQSFLDVQRTLDRIRENSEVPTEDLIQAQKAVGKVTIQRNKENASAIINSNDKLMDHMISFENKMDSMINTMDQSDIDSDMISNQQKIMEVLEKMQTDVKEEISGISSNMEAGIEAIKDEVIREIEAKCIAVNTELMNKVPAVEEPAAKPEEILASEEPAAKPEEILTLEEPAAKPEEILTSEEPAVKAEETSAAEEPAAKSEETSAAKKPAVKAEEISAAKKPAAKAEKTSAAEEPAAKSEKISAAEEPAAKSEKISVAKKPAAKAEKTSAAEEPAVKAEETSVAEEPAAKPEKVLTAKKPAAKRSVSQKEKKAKKQPEESSKSMTPEEIAALLSEMNHEEAEPEPPAEEKVSVPDISDPGHVMTPEEIAALLANM